MAAVGRGLLALGIVLGLTAWGGGLRPIHQAILFGTLTAAAIILVAARGIRLRPALLLPAAAVSMALAAAPIPILGAAVAVGWLTTTLLALALADEFESGAVLGALALAGLAGAVAVFAESVQMARLLGSIGIGAGAAGAMGGANVSGLVVAISIPALLALGRRRGWPYAAISLVVLALVAAVVLTGSRTALLALVVYLLAASRALPARVRLFVGGGLVLVLLAVSAVYLPRVLARLDPDYITNAQRVSMIRGVLEAVADRPWLGHGPWSFPLLGQAYLSWPKWELHPHSLPLRVLFESGLAGLAAWAALLAVAIRGVFARGTAALVDRPATGILVVLAAGSLTDDPLWIPACAFVALSVLARHLPETVVDGRAGRAAWIVVLAALGVVTAAGPRGADMAGLAPVLDPVRTLDRAIRFGTAPAYGGAEVDPNALRVRAWQRWAAGDRRGAESDLLRAAIADPGMIWGPRYLDLAWVAGERGDTAARAAWVDRARGLAPVLTARFLGETTSPHPSPLDWHYGIEFTNPGSIEPEGVPSWEDPLDWRHWRATAARAIVSGETVAARRALAVARRLAGRQYGRDPVLAALELRLGPADAAPASDAAAVSGRERLRQVIAHRDGAAYPWGIYAPLAHRRRAMTNGDNSPWWAAICGPTALRRDTVAAGGEREESATSLPSGGDAP